MQTNALLPLSYLPRRLRAVSANAYVVIAVMTLATVLRVLGINQPMGTYDWGTAEKAIMARNYLRFGYGTTSFLPVYGVIEGHFQRHLDHPPAMPLAISAVFAVFGESEAASRLVSVLLSIATVYVLFLLTKAIWDFKIAILAAFVMSVFPVTVILSRAIWSEPPAVFFQILGLYAYKRWLDKGQANQLWMLCAAIFVGVLFGYPGAFIVPVIILHNLIWAQRKFSFKIAGAVLASGVLPVLVFWFVANIGLPGSVDVNSNPRSPADTLANQFLLRTQYDLLRRGSFYSAILNNLIQWYTPIPLLLGSLWIWEAAKRLAGSSKESSGLEIERDIVWPALLCVVGFSYTLLFPESALIHGLMVVLAAPAIAVAMARTIQLLNPKVGYAILALFGVMAGYQTYFEYVKNELGGERQMCSEVAQFAPTDAIVLDSFPQCTFYLQTLVVRNHDGLGELQIPQQAELALANEKYSEMIILTPFIINSSGSPGLSQTSLAQVDTVAQKYGYTRLQSPAPEIVAWARSQR